MDRAINLINNHDDLSKDFADLLTLNPNSYRLVQIYLTSCTYLLYHAKMKQRLSKLFKRIIMERHRKSKLIEENFKRCSIFDDQSAVVFIQGKYRIGEITHFTEKFSQIVNIPRNQLVGKNINEFMVDMLAVRHNAYIQDFVEHESKTILKAN